MAAIILNKNTEKLKNEAIKIDLILVGITIVIPIVLIKLKIEMNMLIVPLFVLLYLLFRFMNNNIHRNMFLINTCFST